MLHNGTKNCPIGSNITDTENCKEACDELNITIADIREIQPGYVCYKNMQGNCYQNGQIKGGDSLVCEKIVSDLYIV